MDQIEGKVGDVRYIVDKSVVERLMKDHGIDAIKEIEEALKKETHEDQSTKE